MNFARASRPPLRVIYFYRENKNIRMRAAIILFFPAAILVSVCLLLVGLSTANVFALGRAWYYVVRICMAGIIFLIAGFVCNWRVLEVANKIFGDGEAKNSS
jgi:hypothetical protein